MPAKRLCRPTRGEEGKGDGICDRLKTKCLGPQGLLLWPQKMEVAMGRCEAHPVLVSEVKHNLVQQLRRQAGQVCRAHRHGNFSDFVSCPFRDFGISGYYMKTQPSEMTTLCVSHPA